MNTPGPRQVKVGTRGSALAIAQTRWVISQLESAISGIELIEVVISTTGDIRSYDPLLGDGIFVKEIQSALVDGRIDVAVHSLKDLPTQPSEGTEIAAIPVREDPREALVGSTLAALPHGARIGTGSPRRSAQIRASRSDLVPVSIRGNVGTRVAKVGVEVDAVMLAAAGLKRLGLSSDELFDPELILPAPGQGALAIETRTQDPLSKMLSVLHDPATRASVVAERVVLSKLGGGCLLPVAAFGRVIGGRLLLDARVVSPDGARDIRARDEGDPAKPLAVARRVADTLIKAGAREVLAEHE